MAETANIFHGKYMIKQDGIYKNYIVLYPENSTDDVVIGNALLTVAIGDKDDKTSAGYLHKNLSNLIKVLTERLNNRGPISVYNTSAYLKKNNPIIDDKVLVIEYDTGGIKMGDGKTAYNLLKYIGSDIATIKMEIMVEDTVISDIQMILTNYGNKVLEQHGLTASKKPLPDTYTRPLIYFEIEKFN